VHSSPAGQRQADPVTAQVFIFRIVFEPWTGHDEDGIGGSGGGSVVVEVKPEVTPGPAVFGASGESPAQLAEEVAQLAARQAVQKDLPHGAAPMCSVLLLARLPDDLQGRYPTFQTSQARSWSV
jgi:hypothetical protein